MLKKIPLQIMLVLISGLLFFPLQLSAKATPSNNPKDQLILTPSSISRLLSSPIYNLPRWIHTFPITIQKIQSLLNQHNFKTQRNYRYLLNSQVVKLPPSMSLETAKRILQNSNLFSIIENDYSWRAIDSTPCNAEFTSGKLWHLDNYCPKFGTPQADIRALQAWPLRKDATIVAILNSDIRLTHQDLSINLWSNLQEISGNNIDDDANGYIDDLHGINAINGTGNLSDVLECINYAIAKGVHILNNSLGTKFYSPTLEAAYLADQDQGMTIITAAGNGAKDVSFEPRFPGNSNLSHLFNVASTHRNDQLSSFSNTSHGLVNLAAPGSDIFSTTHLNDPDDVENGATGLVMLRLQQETQGFLLESPKIPIHIFSIHKA